MFKKLICIMLSFILLCSGYTDYVHAKEGGSIEIKSKQACLMEVQSGNILMEKASTERTSPASITKIMTLLLIFDALEGGKIKMDDLVTTSAYAKSMGGSQVFLEEGEQQTVETMIKCIVIASGNDASVAMAEHISGSEAVFVEKMNKRAKELGMENTNFEDCCGLTDSDNHYSCAKDVAIMSRELVLKYPKIIDYSSIWMETIIHKTNKGQSEFVLSNTNKLLKTNEYVKGLKTGSTSKAKYCVSIVGIKDGIEMISVIMGAPDYKVRFSEANEILNYGFANCSKYIDYADKNEIKISVKNGTKEKINCGFAEDFCYVSTEKIDFSKIEKKVDLKKNLKAPVDKGVVVGSVKYFIGGKEIGGKDLISRESVEESTYLDKFVRIFYLITNML